MLLLIKVPVLFPCGYGSAVRWGFMEFFVNVHEKLATPWASRPFRRYRTSPSQDLSPLYGRSEHLNNTCSFLCCLPRLTMADGKNFPECSCGGGGARNPLNRPFNFCFVVLGEEELCNKINSILIVIIPSGSQTSPESSGR